MADIVHANGSLLVVGVDPITPWRVGSSFPIWCRYCSGGCANLGHSHELWREVWRVS